MCDTHCVHFERGESPEAGGETSIYLDDNIWLFILIQNELVKSDNKSIKKHFVCKTM